MGKIEKFLMDMRLSRFFIPLFFVCLFIFWMLIFVKVPSLPNNSQQNSLSYVSTAFTGVSLCNAAQTLFFEKKTDTKYGFEYNVLLDALEKIGPKRHLILIIRILSIILLLITTALFLLGDSCIKWIKMCLATEVTICCFLMSLWTLFSLPLVIDVIVYKKTKNDICESIDFLRGWMKENKIPELNSSGNKILLAIRNHLKNNTINHIISNRTCKRYNAGNNNIELLYNIYRKSILDFTDKELKELYDKYYIISFFQMYDAVDELLNLTKSTEDPISLNYKRKMNHEFSNVFFDIEKQLYTNELVNKKKLLISIYAGMIYAIIKSDDNSLFTCVKNACKWEYNKGVNSITFVMFELFCYSNLNFRIIENLKSIIVKSISLYNKDDTMECLNENKDVFENILETLFLLREIDINKTSDLIKDIIDDIENYADFSYSSKSAIINYIKM